MRRAFLSFSVVAVLAMLNGCGGSSSTPTDTTPPKFTNSSYQFDIDELTTKKIVLQADENANFSTDSSDATISGSTLKFTAPAYRVGGKNSYEVVVQAVDSAGNKSSKQFIFNVMNVISDNIKANASYVAPIGNKSFSVVEGYLKDGSGLLWRDGNSGDKSYDDAKRYCESNKGWRLPTREELLNIIDYTKGDSTAKKSLIDSDFKAFSDDSIDASWVEKVGNDKYVVNHKSGADTKEGTNLDHRVICVYGQKADSHTFTTLSSGNIRDEKTGLVWTKITSGTYGTYSEASSLCPSGFNLPSINQLRSIIKDGRIVTSIAPVNDPRPNSITYSIWSNTEVTNDSNSTKLGKAYYVVDVKNSSTVTSDRVNQGHHVTCVKK